MNIQSLYPAYSTRVLLGCPGNVGVLRKPLLRSCIQSYYSSYGTWYPAVHYSTSDASKQAAQASYKSSASEQERQTSLQASKQQVTSEQAGKSRNAKTLVTTTKLSNVVECMMTQHHSSSSLLHSFQSLIRLLRPLKKDLNKYLFAQMHHFTSRRI